MQKRLTVSVELVESAAGELAAVGRSVEVEVVVVGGEPEQRRVRRRVRRRRLRRRGCRRGCGGCGRHVLRATAHLQTPQCCRETSDSHETISLATWDYR